MSDARDGDPRADRAALGGAAPPSRSARAATGARATLDRDERVELFCRARRRVPRRGAPRRRAPGSRRGRRRSARERGATRLVVPAGLPAALAPAPTSSSSRTTGCRHAELDALDGVAHRLHRRDRRDRARSSSRPAPAEGRRALTLVPDLHVCVVARAPDRRARARGARAGSPTRRSSAARSRFVSGPSATSDIELEPRRGRPRPADLVVLVVKESS